MRLAIFSFPATLCTCTGDSKREGLARETEKEGAFTHTLLDGLFYFHCKSVSHVSWQYRVLHARLTLHLVCQFECVNGTVNLTLLLLRTSTFKYTAAAALIAQAWVNADLLYFHFP